MTPSEFANRHPEFASTPESLIQACLDAAEGELHVTTLGTSYNEAHGLLAAHKIALSPYGTAARLITTVGFGGVTVTRTAYEIELLNVVARRVLPLAGS